jgi:molybdenum cofactor synthesis domain-containing protein
VSDRREFHDLASPEAAHETIADLDIEVGDESVPLEAAHGRVLATRIDASLDVPGFDRASMDGYAVAAADTFGADEADPVVLDVAGAVHAGEEPDVAVESGNAVEISTGAVVPPGADAVVMVERTTERDGAVAIQTAVAPGDHIMPAGDDIAAGSRALEPGTRITSREIGLLSALGLETVPVRERPTVGIISTGDELVRPGGDLNSDAGQIYDVNSYTLASIIEAAGGTPTLYPHIGDDFHEMRRQLEEAAQECDLVLSSGSTSASAVDVIYTIIEDHGTLHLHGVALKPGKPLLVGEIGGAAYIGLPGYPVSALTIFRTFVEPVIREVAGLAEPETETATGTMAVRERYEGGRRRLMPVGLVGDGDGNTLVYPVDKGSGATTSLVRADGIVTMPATTNVLETGETVEVQLFSPAIRPPSVLGAGEEDPLFSRVLDRLDRPRHLPLGTDQALRRLSDGVTDVAVTAGPIDEPSDADLLGSWERTWGLVVPDGNGSIDSLSALVDTDYQFVNLGADTGLRRSLDDALAELAVERGTPREDLTESIDGYTVTAAAAESPARSVAAGDAAVGLGLETTAATLDLGFVPLGTQVVRVLANPDRTGKPGVEQLRATLADISTLAASLPGVSDGTD